MKLHDVVKTKVALGSHSLYSPNAIPAGTRGTIVHEYLNTDAVEVEFVDLRITAFVPRKDLEAVNGTENS